MKALIEAALVGLGRAGTPPADPEEPGERLLSRASDLAAERAFLLRLGVHAVRARAGLTPARDGERPEAAPPESRPPCSPPLAAIVADACTGRNKPILLEALTRIDARGLRLPAQGLPALAALRDPTLLPAATNVAGERGRWLARHNPAWRWLIDGVSPASLEERRKAWDEGTPDARLSALRATRATDAAEARAWIDAAWKAEKADFREEMVAALVTNLSADDEPLLTQALADRAAGVRAAGANLLARIETSPFAARARERAEPLLSYAAPARGVLGALKARLAGEAQGVLSVSPPTAFDRAWAADGVVEKPPLGTGERAFWLRQIVAMVPPPHWEQRLGATVEALVKAAAKTHWAQPLLAGWIDATVRFAARGWAEQLWTARFAREPEDARLAALEAAALAPRVFPLMDAARVHETVAEIVEAGGGPMTWSSILTEVPTPWSERLTDAFTRSLTRALANPQLDWQEAHAWGVNLDFAAPAVPRTRLDRVLALEPPSPDAGAQRLVAPFDSFRSVLAIRKRIDQETRS